MRSCQFLIRTRACVFYSIIIIIIIAAVVVVVKGVKIIEQISYDFLICMLRKITTPVVYFMEILPLESTQKDVYAKIE